MFTGYSIVPESYCEAKSRFHLLLVIFTPFTSLLLRILCLIRKSGRIHSKYLACPSYRYSPILPLTLHTIAHPLPCCVRILPPELGFRPLSISNQCLSYPASFSLRAAYCVPVTPCSPSSRRVLTSGPCIFVRFHFHHRSVPRRRCMRVKSPSLPQNPHQPELYLFTLSLLLVA